MEELEPRRVVVKFSAQEFALVDRLSRAEGPGALMRRLALERVAAEAVTGAPFKAAKS
jgi:hypothetical protein